MLRGVDRDDEVLSTLKLLYSSGDGTARNGTHTSNRLRSIFTQIY